MLKKLLQNQQNLKACGIYSCTGIYFFKLALLQNQQNLKADGIYSCTGIYFFKLAKVRHIAYTYKLPFCVFRYCKYAPFEMMDIKLYLHKTDVMRLQCRIMVLQMMNDTLFSKAKSPLKILRIAQSSCHVIGWINFLNGLLRSNRQPLHEPANGPMSIPWTQKVERISPQLH